MKWLIVEPVPPVEKGVYDYQTPLEFYVKIVAEHKNPSTVSLGIWDQPPLTFRIQPWSANFTSNNFTKGTIVMSHNNYA